MPPSLKDLLSIQDVVKEIKKKSSFYGRWFVMRANKRVTGEEKYCPQALIKYRKCHGVGIVVYLSFERCQSNEPPMSNSMFEIIRWNHPRMYTLELMPLFLFPLTLDFFYHPILLYTMSHLSTLRWRILQKQHSKHLFNFLCKR